MVLQETSFLVSMYSFSNNDGSGTLPFWRLNSFIFQGSVLLHDYGGQGTFLIVDKRLALGWSVPSLIFGIIIYIYIYECFSFFSCTHVSLGWSVRRNTTIDSFTTLRRPDPQDVKVDFCSKPVDWNQLSDLQKSHDAWVFLQVRRLVESFRFSFDGVYYLCIYVYIHTISGNPYQWHIITLERWKNGRTLNCQWAL